MIYDVVIAGGGIAGLTAAAFLTKAGKTVLLCEKNTKTGGLINLFDYKGFTFDGGVRSIEDSGIINPMLKQLNIDINLIPSIVTLGIDDQIIRVDSLESVDEYQRMLIDKFPENKNEIINIIIEIKRIMKYMDILYGIENPLFKDLKNDREYIFKTLIPWLFKYLTTVGKVNNLNEAVEDYLSKFTDNQVLIDMIAQHFFKNTPAFFALSYFSLYLDYSYPENGTGELAEKMTEFIIDNGGEILTETIIEEIHPEYKSVRTDAGNNYCYKQLIWAADYKALYKNIVTNDKEIKNNVNQKREYLRNLKGNDSVLTLYLTCDLDKSYFENICSEHLFYTPLKKGLANADYKELLLTTDDKDKVFTGDKEKIKEWLKRYFDYTTYEISIPVLRNEKLAPLNKSGLIISTLFDYSLVKNLKEQGWYEEFKVMAEESIIDILNQTVFPELKANKIDAFVSTPLTMEKYSGNTEGAITGWSFENESVPAIEKLQKVASSVKTDLPDILVAGQWTYSPAGLPISVLTGKLAADAAIKKIK